MTSITNAFPVELNVHILRKLAVERVGGGAWLEASQIIKLSRTSGKLEEDDGGTD